MITVLDVGMIMNLLSVYLLSYPKERSTVKKRFLNRDELEGSINRQTQKETI